MPTLARPYFYFSEAGRCRLAIAFAMTGAEPRQRDHISELRLDTGAALEPVVVEALRRAGLTITHAGERDEQLQLRLRNPEAHGRPDGIASLGPEGLSLWLEAQLDDEARRILYSGERILLEIKTMSSAGWKTLQASGFEGSTQLARNFLQVQFNLAALQALQKTALGRKRFGSINPSAALLVAFNTDNKRPLIRTVAFDEITFEEERAHLCGLLDTLRLGQMPISDYTGDDPECFNCDFSHLCSAVAEVRELRLAKLGKVTASVEDAILPVLESMAADYYILGQQIAALEAQRKELREDITQAFTANGTVITDRWAINKTESKGRQTLDQQEATRLLLENSLPVPMKEGKPFVRLTVRALAGPDEGGGE